MFHTFPSAFPKALKKGRTNFSPGYKNHYPFSALVREWRYNVERQSVKSVILNSVGYDESTKTLEIEFQTGLVYRYSGVPLKVYDDLMHSNEMGKYFSEKIRPRFHTKQVVA